MPVKVLAKKKTLFIASLCLIALFDYALAETIPTPPKRPNFSNHSSYIIPVPSKKPIVKPAETEKDKKASSEPRLISFALKSDQIDLDPSLEQFLLDHVVKLSQNNPTLNIEIQAYATPEDEQEHSDMRRSLARGLEVRRFLLSKNISPTRLTLSAMGQDKSNKSDNRIDLLFTVPE